MQIEGRFIVDASPGQLMEHLLDAGFMASCLPGCEALERLDDQRYRTTVCVTLAGIKARFNLQVEITKRDEHNVWSIARGEEGGRASTLQADSHISLQPQVSGTEVAYASEVALNGRFGRFALGMMKKKAQSIGEEFAENLRARLGAA